MGSHPQWRIHILEGWICVCVCLRLRVCWSTQAVKRPGERRTPPSHAITETPQFNPMVRLKHRPFKRWISDWLVRPTAGAQLVRSHDLRSIRTNDQRAQIRHFFRHFWLCDSIPSRYVAPHATIWRHSFRSNDQRAEHRCVFVWADHSRSLMAAFRRADARGTCYIDSLKAKTGDS
jgi:hypothetical protein